MIFPTRCNIDAGPTLKNASLLAIERGDLSAALYHAMLTDDATLSAILGAHPERFARAGQASLINECLIRLQSEVWQNGGLAYLCVLMKQQVGSPDIFAAIETGLSTCQATDDEHFAMLLQCMQFELRLGRLEPGLRAEIQSFINELPIGNESALEQLWILLGWAYAIEHDFKSSYKLITPISQVSTSSHYDDLAVLRAYVFIALGNLREASDIMDALVRKHETSGSFIAQIRAVAWSARFALLRGEMLAAFDGATEALRLCEQVNLETEMGALYAVLAEVATHLGDPDAIIDAAEKMQRYAADAWYSADARRIPAMTRIFTARALFLRGESLQAHGLAVACANDERTPGVLGALAWAESMAYSAIAGTKDGHVTDTTSVAARFLAATNIDALDATYLNSAFEMVTFFSNITIHEHPELQAFRRFVEARAALIPFHQLSSALGSVDSITVEKFDGVAELLRIYARKGARFEILIAVVYLRKIIQTLGLRVPSVERVIDEMSGLFAVNCPLFAKKALAPPITFDLTPRETQILELLSHGLSNREIAERFSLSPRTVETHVERVLAKLDVTTRSRAIAKAIRLGIVGVE